MQSLITCLFYDVAKESSSYDQIWDNDQLVENNHMFLMGKTQSEDLATQ